MSDVEELDEDALFDTAVSDETTETPVVAEQQQQTEEQATTSQEAETETTELTAEKPPIPPKPEWRLKEDAEARRAAEAELANERAEKAALKQRLDALEQANKPKPAQKEEEDDGPDPLLDPKGYKKHVREEIRTELLNERREESMKAAREKDAAAFDEAYQASLEAMRSGDVTIRARMHSSRDPGRTLIEWHTEQKAIREVGADPNAYVQRKLEEALKDPAFLAKAIEASKAVAQTQQSNGRPKVELPPSLNGASRSNAQLRSAMNADVDDDALWNETTA